MARPHRQSKRRTAVKILTLALFMLPAVSLMAISAQPSLALYNATRKGALAKICLHVVDPAGHPVAGAKVWGGLQTGGNLGDFTPISGVTDTNGEYVIQGRCTNRIRCDITKTGVINRNSVW